MRRTPSQLSIFQFGRPMTLSLYPNDTFLTSYIYRSLLQA